MGRHSGGPRYSSGVGIGFLGKPRERAGADAQEPRDPDYEAHRVPEPTSVGGQVEADHSAEPELLDRRPRRRLRRRNSDVPWREVDDPWLQRYLMMSQFLVEKGLKEEFLKWASSR